MLIKVSADKIGCRISSAEFDSTVQDKLLLVSYFRLDWMGWILDINIPSRAAATLTTEFQAMNLFPSMERLHALTITACLGAVKETGDVREE